MRSGPGLYPESSAREHSLFPITVMYFWLLLGAHAFFMLSSSSGKRPVSYYSRSFVFVTFALPLRYLYVIVTVIVTFPRYSSQTWIFAEWSREIQLDFGRDNFLQWWYIPLWSINIEDFISKYGTKIIVIIFHCEQKFSSLFKLR